MIYNLYEYLAFSNKNYSEKNLLTGSCNYTIGKLYEDSTKSGWYLISIIKKIRTPIVVYLDKDQSTIIANLSILRSGNFYTNLDVKSPIDRIYSILININPSAIITHSKYAHHFSEFTDSRPVIFIDQIDLSAIDQSVCCFNSIDQQVIDTDPACLINTSGSTGVPKSVVLSHRAIIDFIEWVTTEFCFNSESIIGSLSPFYFDIYTMEIFTALKTGASINIIPEKLSSFPVALVDYLDKNRINFIFWVPTIMVNIANLDLLRDREIYLRTIFFAGEVFPTKQLNYWIRNLPSTRFINLYGPIEIAVDCTYYIIDREFSENEPIPIGKPCRNTGLLLLNDKNEECQIGEKGELCVRGSSLALGYYNNPDQTDKSFVQNPLNKSYNELIYRTGDIVYYNERLELMFCGRKDFQIKHLGYRIELSEIENAIQSLNYVSNNCVHYNQIARQIVAIYESKDHVSDYNIRSDLIKILPKYMIPTKYIKVLEMPRNPNGKIDRNFLYKKYID